MLKIACISYLFDADIKTDPDLSLLSKCVKEHILLIASNTQQFEGKIKNTSLCRINSRPELTIMCIHNIQSQLMSNVS